MLCTLRQVWEVKKTFWCNFRCRKIHFFMVKTIKISEIFCNSHILLEFHWFSWPPLLKFTVTSKRQKSILWVSESIFELRLTHSNSLGCYMKHYEMNLDAAKCTFSWSKIWFFFQISYSPWISLIFMATTFEVYRDFYASNKYLLGIRKYLRTSRNTLKQFWVYMKHSEINFDAGKCTFHDQNFGIFPNFHILLQFYWFSWPRLMKFTVNSKRQKSILWLSKNIPRPRVTHSNNFGGYMRHSEMKFDAEKCTFSWSKNLKFFKFPHSPSNLLIFMVASYEVFSDF